MLMHNSAEVWRIYEWIPAVCCNYLTIPQKAESDGLLATAANHTFYQVT